MLCHGVKCGDKVISLGVTFSLCGVFMDGGDLISVGVDFSITL